MTIPWWVSNKKTGSYQPFLDQSSQFFLSKLLNFEQKSLDSIINWGYTIYMAPFAITQHFQGANVLFCILRFHLWWPNRKVSFHQKVEKNMLKNKLKNVENRLFSTFFDDFQLFFQHIFFNCKILSFWWKVTFHNGFSSREENVTYKNRRISGWICCFLHVTFSPLVGKPLCKVTFQPKDKILFSSWRP